MEGGPPIFRQDCSCPALLEDGRPGFPYGAVPRYGPPFQTLPVPKPTAAGLVRFRSPLLAESRLMSVPPATEMFQFAGFASRAYEFSAGYPQELPLGGGLPHSEIPGSTIARISPGLFAACRVLHRLSVPRHPPDALLSRSIRGAPAAGVAAGHDTPPGKPPRTGANVKRPALFGPIAPCLGRGSLRSFETVRSAWPPRRGPRMKTLLRTAPDTSQDHTGQDPRPRLSASVTFANPLYPSINPGPAAAAARPAGPRPLEAMARPARPAAAPEPNFIFSERRWQRAEIRKQRSESRDQITTCEPAPPAIEAPGGGAWWR